MRSPWHDILFHLIVVKNTSVGLLHCKVLGFLTNGLVKGPRPS